jgi:ribosomal protein S27AE
MKVSHYGYSVEEERQTGNEPPCPACSLGRFFATIPALSLFILLCFLG